MKDRSLIQIISLLAVFISLLLVAFLLTVKTKHRLGNVLFGAFILLNALDISSWFLNPYLDDYPTLLLFKSTLGTLINPTFYLYALAVCYADFRLRPRHVCHLLPFALLTLGLAPRFYLANEAAKLAFLQHYHDLPEATFSLVLGELQFVGYFTAVFLTLRRYKQTFRENYADASSITYDWLFQLTATLTVLHAIVVSKNLLPYTAYPEWFAGAELLVGVNATFILSWFTLKALYNPALFRSIDSTLEPVEQLVAEARVGEEGGEERKGKGLTETADLKPAPDPGQDARVRHLRAHMEQAEPYLDPALTIQDLANQLGMPARELSLLINHHLGQHFFDFVNAYRIAKAQRLLAEARPGLTVLEVLYAVGFNSKSSFNTAFKKQTGQTPTQYRNA